MKRLFLSVLAIAALTTPAFAQTKLQANNIDKIMKQMTLEEKARLLVGYIFGESYFGIPTSGDTSTEAIVPGAAGNTADVERLGIPFTVVADGPAGLRIDPKRKNTQETFYCSGFPVGSHLSSTWNTDLVENLGEAMGNEVLEYGVDLILGPGMNIMRSPLCGRNFEYYSEDPVLAGFIAAAMINGIQSQGVGTSPKHFAANSQESNRTFNNAVIDARPLREIYLKAFEIMVRNSKPWTIMSSYNKINGQYTQESHDLLTKVLRDDWGFDGIVMTDWIATRNTADQVAAGNDLLMPGVIEQYEQIVEGVNNGTIKMTDVDRNVKRILEYVVKTPRFKGYKFSNNPDIAAHAAVIRKAAPEGMVLLKNDNRTLPVSADKKLALFGMTSYNLYAGGTGSGDVNKPYVVDLLQGLENAGYTLDPVLKEVYTAYRTYAKAEAESEMGEFTTNWYFPRPRVCEPRLGVHTYQHAASRNDAAIVTIGRSSGEGCDRTFADFTINPDEIEMLKGVYEAFHAKGLPVIVILNVGGVVETEPVKQYADAILLAWQPGMEAGNSIADVLSGAAYPSGHLPMTWPVKLDDVPSTANFPKDFDWRQDVAMSQDDKNALPFLGETRYEEGLNVGYRYFQTAGVPVSYPFGYGLGYTTFDVSDAKVASKGKKFQATVKVRNTGNAAGKETVQLYVAAPKGQLEKPAFELKAFAKTPELQPGEEAVLTMEFTPYDLASYDPDQNAFVTDAGEYIAMFAVSAEDVRQQVPFNVKAAKTKVSRLDSLDKVK